MLHGSHEVDVKANKYVNKYIKILINKNIKGSESLRDNSKDFGFAHSIAQSGHSLCCPHEENY